MSSRRREQILENCCWLFGHEVQIITFALRSYLKQNPNSPTRSGPYEIHYYAAVLPKTCFLTSLASRDLEEKILLKEFHLLSSDGATSKLLETVEKKIGMMLETDNGRICISPLELSGEDKVDKTPVVQQAASKTPPLPVVAPKKSGGTVQPKGINTPMTLPGAIVPEQTKLFFQTLPVKPPPPSSTRRASWGTASALPSSIKHLDSKPKEYTRGELLRSIEDYPLTAYNLSLLENEHKNTEQSPKKFHPKPQKRRPTVPPKLGTKIGSSLKLLRTKATPLELRNRVKELEEKLNALDAHLKGDQARLYRFCGLLGPIMTPATSVASTEAADTPGIKLVSELESNVPLPPTSGGGLGAQAFLFA